MNDNNDDRHASGHQQGDETPAMPESRSTPALIEKFVIRLPKGLRKKTKHLSEQNRRSMNSEIIMVLEKHIQQNLSDDVAEFVTDANLQARRVNTPGIEKMSDDELTRRLENLPEEKKQALLELLG